MENILKINDYRFDESSQLFEVNLVSYKSSDIEESEKFAEISVPTTLCANPIKTTIDLFQRDIIMYHENTVHTEDDDMFPITEIHFVDGGSLSIFLTYEQFNKFYRDLKKGRIQNEQ